MTITIDVPPEVAETLQQKAAEEGRDVAGYVQRLAIQASGVPASERTTTLRTPGLHAGRYWIAADFDAPLPDSFWLGEDMEGTGGV